MVVMVPSVLNFLANSLLLKVPWLQQSNMAYVFSSFLDLLHFILTGTIHMLTKFDFILVLHMSKSHYSSKNHCHHLFYFFNWLCCHVAQQNAFHCRFVHCVLMILVCNSHGIVSSEKEISFFLQQIPSCIQGSYLNHGSSYTISKNLLFPQSFFLLQWDMSSTASFGLVLPFYPHIHLRLL